MVDIIINHFHSLFKDLRNSTESRMKDKGEFSKKLGSRIREIRESKKISLRELELMENSMDRSLLSKIENGQITPSVYTLDRICTLLEITLEDFFKGFK